MLTHLTSLYTRAMATCYAREVMPVGFQANMPIGCQAERICSVLQDEVVGWDTRSA